MKECIKCNTVKEITDFHKKKDAKDGYRNICKKCSISIARKWAADNPERVTANWKKNSALNSEHRSLVKRARIYGLSLEEIKTLIESANGICQICKMPPKRWLVIDHCHTTNLVRGVLCEQCNQALGMFKDSPEIMESAIRYILAGVAQSGREQQSFKLTE